MVGVEETGGGRTWLTWLVGPARRRSGWLKSKVRAQDSQTGLLLGTPWGCGWERGDSEAGGGAACSAGMVGPPPGWGACAGRAGYEGPGRSCCCGLSTCHRGAISGGSPALGTDGTEGEKGGGRAGARRCLPGRWCLPTQGTGWAGAPASHSAGHSPLPPPQLLQSQQPGSALEGARLAGPQTSQDPSRVCPPAPAPACVLGWAPPRCASRAPSRGRCAACGQGWVSF